MPTPPTSRRDETATVTTLTDNTHTTADKMTYHLGKRQYFEDDEKTLTDYTMNDSSSTRSKSSLSETMTHLKSKFKTKNGKPKKKTTIPPDYYPTTLKTFEALHASRM
ncbi:hypothetical protein F4808DRAFT_61850 [Astrocystis sublimbata]|nr:hypothetical protein F4808DRAFT_61850 [Astrocystis sublimbata]